MDENIDVHVVEKDRLVVPELVERAVQRQGSDVAVNENWLHALRFQRLEDRSAFSQVRPAPEDEEGMRQLAGDHLDVVGQELLTLFQGGRSRDLGDLFGLRAFVHFILTHAWISVRSDAPLAGVPKARVSCSPGWCPFSDGGVAP